MGEDRIKLIEVVSGVWTVEESLTPIIKRNASGKESSK